MKQKISMGSTEQALVITNMVFDADGFVIHQRAALVPFDPSKNPVDILDKASKYEWELYGLQNLHGFVSARQKRQLTEDELKKQIMTASARTVINEVVEDEATSKKLAATPTAGTNTGSRVNTNPLLEV